MLANCGFRVKTRWARHETTERVDGALRAPRRPKRQEGRPARGAAEGRRVRGAAEPRHWAWIRQGLGFQQRHVQPIDPVKRSSRAGQRAPHPGE
jgi:hypothetical protein